MTQEFHISVTPIGDNEYLVRTERVAPGVPLAEEQVSWPVEDWLTRAGSLMNDPLLGLLRGESVYSFSNSSNPLLESSLGSQDQRAINLVKFGQQLYSALFQGTIRDSWVMAQGIAQHRQEVLRLRLGLKDSRLPRLPWEVLGNDRPIATGTDVLFSRYHSSFAVMSSPFQFQQFPSMEPGQALKILMVLAAPTDQEALALRQEALHLQEELQGTLRNGNRNSRFSEIQLTILEQPGREQLTQALEHNHYQVLHYAGHSGLGAAGGKLYLVSSKTGLTETLNGEDLAGLLVNNGIRMAVFNSCQGGYTATTESAADAGEGNLAEALVKRGIPAVLAMAERIPDDVALNLSRLFYRNLKQLYPIDLSLSRARQGLLSSYGSNQLYWALPILYLHPEFDGHLQPPHEPVEEPEIALVNDRLGDESSWQPPSSVADAALPENLPEDLPEDLLEDSDSRLNPEPSLEPSLEPSEDVAADNLDEFDDDPLLDSDDLEFDEPEYHPDDGSEKVAQLVRQLSQNSLVNSALEKPLPASPNENLWPREGEETRSENYLILPDNPRYGSYPVEAANHQSPIHQEVAPPVEDSFEEPATLQDGSVYLELERLLAETGKLTEAIAVCNRTIQENPNSAEAYDRLGWALSQQGYLAEAISAYNQALRVNPKLAEAHNHLGLALYQQGNVREAIRAYSRAVQLNPQLEEAHRNLDVALRKQGVYPAKGQPLPPNQTQVRQNTGRGIGQGLSRPMIQPSPPHEAPSAQKVEYAAPPAASKPANRKSLLWAGAGTVGLTGLLLSGWFLYSQVAGSLPQILAGQALPSIENISDLTQVSTPVLSAIATEQLNQGNIQKGQQAIEVLLDRGALTQTATVLSPVLSKKGDSSTINFLMGRLAWQFVQSGNSLYSVEDARHAWEKAAKQESTVIHQNALGFAYYAEGQLDLARLAWLQSVQLTEATPRKTAPPQTNVASAQDSLTAYAGLALVLMKKADEAPPRKGALIRSEAINLRQRVLNEGSAQFKPDALDKNWLWSEKSIQDWKTLLSLKRK
ncbi:MAG: CHAT domain-containing protein [Kovacikia sp.]